MIIYEILTGTLLRFYNDFIEFVRSDPKQRYTGVDNKLHPLEVKIENAFSYAGVSAEERQAWFNEIRQDFYTKNLHALPINESNVNYRRVFVDSRSVMEIMHGLAVQQQQFNQLYFNQSHDIQNLGHQIKQHLEPLQNQLNAVHKELKETKEVSLNSLLVFPAFIM